MKKLHYFALVLLLTSTLFGCIRRIDTDFSFSPHDPKIGDTVRFTNLSSGGEEWLWTFRNEATTAISLSRLENPTHVFSLPGLHTVILRVDENDRNVRTRQIMVYDSIPFIARNRESVEIFTDVTFRSVAFNPTGRPRTFEWHFSLNARGSSLEYSEDGTYQISRIAQPTVYFTRRGVQETVMLHTTVGDSVYTIHQVPHDVFIVEDVAARSLLMAQQDGQILRQRLFSRGNDVVESAGIDAGANPFNIVTTNTQLFVFDAGSNIEANPNWATDISGNGSIRVYSLLNGNAAGETVITNTGMSSYYGFFNGFVSSTHIYWTDRNDNVYRVPINARNQTFQAGASSPFFVADYSLITGMNQGQFNGGIYHRAGIYYWAKGNGGGGIFRFTRNAEGQISMMPERPVLLQNFAIRSFVFDWQFNLVYFVATASPQGPGLFVAASDGTMVQLIDNSPMDSALEYITGLAIDRISGNLFWAYRAPEGSGLQSGIKQVRLLQSPRELPGTPTFLNYEEGIMGIAIDNNLTYSAT